MIKIKKWRTPFKELSAIPVSTGKYRDRTCEKLVHNYIKKHNIDIRLHPYDVAYAPIGNFIDIVPKTSFYVPECYYSTLFHELTHSTGTPNRLARYKHIGSYFSESPKHVWTEELIAETGSYLLCAHAGILPKTQSYHLSYMQAVAKCSKLSAKEIDRMFTHALKEAKKAVDFILSA